MHSPGKIAQEGIVENMHSTRIKRDFCKLATKTDSNTTHEKGVVHFRDGNNTLRWWHFELKTPAVLKISTVQMCKFPQNLRAPVPSRWKWSFFLFFFLVCVLQHVRWRHWISVHFMKSYILSKFLDNRLPFNSKSTPHTEKVTHVFWWHRKLCAN